MFQFINYKLADILKHHMQDLETLKSLQITYQEKFAALLKLQEELGISGNEATASPEYNMAKEEWVKASISLKSYLGPQ